MLIMREKKRERTLFIVSIIILYKKMKYLIDENVKKVNE